jgi:hypothetical protein
MATVYAVRSTQLATNPGTTDCGSASDTTMASSLTIEAAAKTAARRRPARSNDSVAAQKFLKAEQERILANPDSRKVPPIISRQHTLTDTSTPNPSLAG